MEAFCILGFIRIKSISLSCTGCIKEISLTKKRMSILFSEQSQKQNDTLNRTVRKLVLHNSRNFILSKYLQVSQRRLISSRQYNITVAHNCHGKKNKTTTIQLKSRQHKQSYSKNKEYSRKNKENHSKIKNTHGRIMEATAE